MTRAVDDPRSLVALRSELIACASEHEGVWFQTEHERVLREAVGFGSSTFDERGNLVISGPKGYGGDELVGLAQAELKRAHQQVDLYRQHLTHGQLVYVTPDLVDVVTEAADAAPDDLTLEPGDLPAPSGLVVFGKPVWGTDAGPETPGQPVRVDAILWGNALLPAFNADWNDPKVAYTVPAMSIGALRLIDRDQDDRLAAEWNGAIRSSVLPVWVPLGRSDWPYTRPLAEQHRTDLPDTAHASMVEDRRLMAALFATLNQRRLVDVETLEPTKAQVKKARKYRRPELRPVIVVHLRRTEHRPVESVEGRRVGVRFPVRPFYRRQPVGPRGEGRRKIVLVPGHWRGPVDGPVVHAERVWSLDR